ncbi:MAG: DMT family transporter [Pseudomonadota bacterium]
MTKPGLQAFLLGLTAAFFSGTHSVIVRHLTEHLHGSVVAVLRLYVASIALFLILKMYRKPLQIDWANRALIVTVLAFSVNFVVFHWGLEYTGAASSMVLENTAPIFVLIFSALVLRAPIRPVEVAATFLAVFGVYFTVRGDFVLGPSGILGDELELVAGLTWAIFLMASTQFVSGTSTTFERLTFLFAVLSLSSLVLTPFLLAFPPGLTGWDIVLLLLLGIFPTAIAYYLWYETAARVSAMTTSLLFTLTVVFTFMNAAIFLGESITANVLIGGALIVTSVLLSKKRSG